MQKHLICAKLKLICGYCSSKSFQHFTSIGEQYNGFNILPNKQYPYYWGKQNQQQQQKNKNTKKTEVLVWNKWNKGFSLPLASHIDTYHVLPVFGKLISIEWRVGDVTHADRAVSSTSSHIQMCCGLWVFVGITPLYLDTLPSTCVIGF